MTIFISYRQVGRFEEDNKITHMHSQQQQIRDDAKVRPLAGGLTEGSCLGVRFAGSSFCRIFWSSIACKVNGGYRCRLKRTDTLWSSTSVPCHVEGRLLSESSLYWARNRFRALGENNQARRVKLVPEAWHREEYFRWIILGITKSLPNCWFVGFPWTKALSNELMVAQGIPFWWAFTRSSSSRRYAYQERVWIQCLDWL